MSLTHALLGVLEARPMNGYELTQFFDSAARWIWSAPQSQIYTTLVRMQKDGLIEGASQVRANRKQSSVYTITELGYQELRQWVGSGHPLPPVRDAFLLQSLFFDVVEPDDAAKAVNEFIAEHEQRILQWEAHRDMLLAKETPLIQERLRRRPAEQHEWIARLKAHVFQGEIDRASASVAWGRQMLEILQDAPFPK